MLQVQHQQGCRFCQRFLLSAQLTLQPFVLDLQLTQRGFGLACFASRSGAKSIAPALQLVLEQTLFSAPGRQLLGGHGMGFEQGLQALRGGPRWGGKVLGQLR